MRGGNWGDLPNAYATPPWTSSSIADWALLNWVNFDPMPPSQIQGQTGADGTVMLHNATWCFRQQLVTRN